eukprot:m.14156 g.14156  ORF g.14156 m.14156 type:complete len:421 (+) comp25569_c0_seq4:214-1476(+)
MQEPINSHRGFDVLSESKKKSLGESVADVCEEAAKDSLRAIEAMLSSKPSQAALHRHFPSLSAEECAYDSFRCALSKEILINGRLYVTSKHFCFHSNILGIEKKFAIDCSEISAITQERTLMIFPNAIGIRMNDGSQYLFSSFYRRDMTHRLLFRIWHAVLSRKPLAAEEFSEVKKGKGKKSLDGMGNSGSSVSTTDEETPTEKASKPGEKPVKEPSDTSLEPKVDRPLANGSVSANSSGADSKGKRSLFSQNGRTGHFETSISEKPKEMDHVLKRIPECRNEESDEGSETSPRIWEKLWGLFKHFWRIIPSLNVSKWTLLTLLAFVAVFLFAVSTFLLACQMSAVDPVVARYFPLKSLCRFEPVESRLSSFSLTLEDSIATVDKALKEMQHLQGGICLSTTPAAFNGLSTRLRRQNHCH